VTILEMSKLRAIAPKDIRRPLMKELTRVGCVEIESSAVRLAEEEWQDVLKKFFEASDVDQRLSVLTSARELLDKYVPDKSGFLSSRRLVTEQEFHDESITNGACDAAAVLNELGRQLTACAGEEGRLAAKKISLLAWNSLDVPLDIKSGKHYKIVFGVSPAAGAPAKELVDEASSKDLAELVLVSSDREQNYYLLLVHSGMYDEVMDRLKSKGFSIISFKDAEGTASENISQLETQLQDIENRRLEIIGKIKEFAGQKDAIEQTIDVFTIESARDQVLSGLAGTQKTLLLEGWTPKECEAKVVEILDRYGCAHQFEAPGEDDDVPVLLQNHHLVTPFTVVTDLFALPTYKSGLDPNPFMAPFFFLFFGIMTGDVGYGIMIALASWYILKKSRPAEGSEMKRLLQMGALCGISAIVWGLLFGGFFGNIVPAFTGTMLGNQITLRPMLFDPVGNVMSMLAMALALGFIQVCFGLGLNAYKLIKHNRPMDAFFDAGLDILLLFGVLLCIVSTNAGLAVMGLSALGMLLTGGRENSNIIAKLFGGFVRVYNCINYLSDILSYSRLMGLALAAAIIAQVVNTIGLLIGPSTIGWVVFVPIFILGHTFNILIGLLGAFVHSTRLQFIEFFNKFYEYGGKEFTPLFNKTQYVEMK